MLWQTRPLNPLCVCLAKKLFAGNFSLTPQRMQYVCHVGQGRRKSGGQGRRSVLLSRSLAAISTNVVAKGGVAGRRRSNCINNFLTNLPAQTNKTAEIVNRGVVERGQGDLWRQTN